MKTVELSGNKRATTGKNNAAQLRKEGKIPCVLYGGKDNIHFSVDAIKFEKLIYTPEVFFINLDVDGDKYKAIIKDVQFNPVSDKASHVDFQLVEDNKETIVKLPVKLTGSSKGVLAGGKLRMVSRRLKVKGLPADLPENIEVDITNLKIGDSIKVGELNLNGITFLDSPNAVVAAVRMSRAAMSGADEELEEETSEETPAEEKAEAAE